MPDLKNSQVTEKLREDNPYAGEKWADDPKHWEALPPASPKKPSPPGHPEDWLGHMDVYA